MKAKLAKTGQDYILYSESKETLAISNGRMVGRILSIKNCEAIERGYDLFELAKDYSKGKSSANVFRDAHEEDFKKGFQKALEVLGDKKFSENDIARAFIQGVYTKDEIHFNKETYIQSLQQTEWDVEIYMGIRYRQIDCVDDARLIESKVVKDGEVPMLDKDGCLILKRL